MSALPAVGDEFSSPTIPVSFSRMLAFSGGPLDMPGWPLKNLHSDYEKARQAGLALPIASGIQAEAHAIRMLSDAFGDAWFTTGMLDVKHAQPLAVGDEFVLRLRITEREVNGSSVRYVGEIKGERPNGGVTLVGRAEVTVERG